MLLRLLIEERQLAGGFASAGRHKFNILNPAFGKIVYIQFQPCRADELGCLALISAGATGQPYGKVLANRTKRPPGKAWDVQSIVHLPYVRAPGIGKQCRQAKLRRAGFHAGANLFLQVSCSGPAIELCMPPIRQPSRHQLLFHPDPPARHAWFCRW